MDDMTDRERAAELLWQRDEARAKVVRLERELEHTKMLLSRAEEAIRAEYERANAALRR
jgi:hypothetical protein